LRRFESKAIRGVRMPFEYDLPVPGRSVAKQSAGAREVDEVDAIVSDGFHDAGQQRGHIERVRGEIPEIPIGVRTALAARAGAEQQEQLETGSRARGLCERIDREDYRPSTGTID
jgi:hypothetical protein